MSPFSETSNIPGSAWLCVLASGAEGNCSVLVLQYEGMRRACLIDLGLSPRRTVRLLAELDLGLHQIDDVFITHLDSDHFRPGWAKVLPRHVRVHLHASHARGVADCLSPEILRGFDGDFTFQAGVRVSHAMLPHDDTGVCAVRLDMPAEVGGGSLGFATDLGRATPELIRLYRVSGAGVDVLAIESNYCPRMQAESGRPYQLIRRITGGYGHLSNQQAIEAIRQIEPGHHVVLLHLSQDCNCPDLVASMHEGADYHLTITSQSEPTRWIRIGPAKSRPVAAITLPPPGAEQARAHGVVSVMKPRPAAMYTPSLFGSEPA